MVAGGDRAVSIAAWPVGRLAWVSLIWIALVICFFVGRAMIWMGAVSGEGDLVGISVGVEALSKILLIAFGPPLILVATWLVQRRTK